MTPGPPGRSLGDFSPLTHKTAYGQDTMLETPARIDQADSNLTIADLCMEVNEMSSGLREEPAVGF
ncbi:MAG: hypothetical protein J07HQW1_02268 [Haloquadratum walsbyi J07HQW1]|uniref:Uncharacterized protein n=1 Tax=Haloquadratum walsbyi J07HQW1 TaxID=1238424 RepID=U1N6Y7_9EURY|nr:MAG: hypothetical protein J07HQW1_02268 [Haloquadratum walsbyi J07HQW1]